MKRFSRIKGFSLMLVFILIMSSVGILAIDVIPEAKELLPPPVALITGTAESYEAGRIEWSISNPFEHEIKNTKVTIATGSEPPSIFSTNENSSTVLQGLQADTEYTVRISANYGYTALSVYNEYESEFLSPYGYFSSLAETEADFRARNNLSLSDPIIYTTSAGIDGVSVNHRYEVYIEEGEVSATDTFTTYNVVLAVEPSGAASAGWSTAPASIGAALFRGYPIFDSRYGISLQTSSYTSDYQFVEWYSDSGNDGDSVAFEDASIANARAYFPGGIDIYLYARYSYEVKAEPWPLGGTKGDDSLGDGFFKDSGLHTQTIIGNANGSVTLSAVNSPTGSFLEWVTIVNDSVYLVSLSPETTVLPTEPTVYYAVFEDPKFTITADSLQPTLGEGYIEVIQDETVTQTNSATFLEPTTITLQANETNGRFVKWVVAIEDDLGTIYIDIGTDPRIEDVKVNENDDFFAVFEEIEPETFTIGVRAESNAYGTATIRANQEFAAVGFNPLIAAAIASTSDSIVLTIPNTTQISLIAEPLNDGVFVRWTEVDAVTGAFIREVGTDLVENLTPTEAATFVAEFTPPELNPFTIKASSEYPDMGDAHIRLSDDQLVNSQGFDNPDTVTLVAVPKSGYHFRYWAEVLDDGSLSKLSGVPSSVTVLYVSTDREFRALFQDYDAPVVPTPEPTPTPVPTPEPTPESTPVPTPEPSPEPTPEPTPEPMPEIIEDDPIPESSEPLPETSGIPFIFYILGGAGLIGLGIKSKVKR